MTLPRVCLPRVCLIGAGTSGLITAKVLKDHDIPFDCFERGSGLGGLWRFQNDNGMSTCYRSLHINTSKRMMELSDFKFLPEIAEYPSHGEILSEFERYADTFDLRQHIAFNTTVEHCQRESEGGWSIRISGPGGIEEHRYDFLMVANGHHWDPRMADFPGSFDGAEIHAHHYVDTTEPIDLAGKNVVVVGMGNSAMDIACELGHMGQGAERVYLAQRSGVWIIPKILGSIPQDKFMRHPMVKPGLGEHIKRRLIPGAMGRFFNDKLIETIIKLTVGHPTRVGLKAPEEHFHMRHPTVSQEIHNRLVHGDVIPKGNIRELRGKEVEFEDGSVEEVDAIIHATGYRINFPFFDKDFMAAEGNSIPLFQRIFDPRFNDLAFVALVQPVCAMMPIAELQASLLADYITGEYHLPEPEEMRRRGLAVDAAMKARYTTSESHTIQIDCPEYSYYLREEWRRGAKRAKRAGNALPVSARAAGSFADSTKAAE